jgi:hypothetical protein
MCMPRGLDERRGISSLPTAARKDPKTVVGAFGDVSQGDPELRTGMAEGPRAYREANTLSARLA